MLQSVLRNGPSMSLVDRVTCPDQIEVRLSCVRRRPRIAAASPGDDRNGRPYPRSHTREIGVTHKRQKGRQRKIDGVGRGVMTHVIRGPLRAPPSTPKFFSPGYDHFTTRLRIWVGVRISSGAPPTSETLIFSE
jgi:hypothetical protein